MNVSTTVSKINWSRFWVASILMGSSLFSNKITLNANEWTSKNGYNNCNFFTNGENCCLSRNLNKNSVVIFDVGANIGDWTLMALKYAPTAQIYAFEPHPEIFKVLLSKSRNMNIKCLPFALSDQEGLADFWEWGDNTNVEKSGLNGLFYRPILKEMFSQNPGMIQVYKLTLDDICEKNNVKHIDYLKIDTEGNEYFVLLGANRMISNRSIEIIQFEYGGCYIDSNTRLETVYKFLTERGYDIFRILPETLLPITNWDPKLENFQYSNYIAILNKKL